MAGLFHGTAAAMIAARMGDAAVRAAAFAETASEPVCELWHAAIWRRAA